MPTRSKAIIVATLLTCFAPIVWAEVVYEKEVSADHKFEVHLSPTTLPVTRPTSMPGRPNVTFQIDYVLLSVTDEREMARGQIIADIPRGASAYNVFDAVLVDTAVYVLQRDFFSVKLVEACRIGGRSDKPPFFSMVLNDNEARGYIGSGRIVRADSKSVEVVLTVHGDTVTEVRKTISIEKQK